MYYRLLDCGVPAKHLVYNKVGFCNLGRTFVHAVARFMQA
jgi:hypothetical protein